MIVELSHNNFDAIISHGSVLVDFWADWCGPCRMLGPTIDEIANDYPEIVVGKINVDEFPEIASKHGVMSIPTLLFFKDGVIKDSSIGVVPKSVIINKLNALSN